MSADRKTIALVLKMIFNYNNTHDPNNNRLSLA